jgi:hypothetical protein
VRLHCICVDELLTVAAVCAIVLPNVFVRVLVAFWLAAMPGGMAIKMAMQKLSATTISAALVLRRERFLNARVMMPILSTL